MRPGSDHRTVARGWSADWLNGWLAAIGATVVLDGARLSWVGAARPVAVLHNGGDDLAAALHEALPTEEDLGRSSSARTLPGLPELPRNYGSKVFAARSRHARQHDDWSLGPAATDLGEVDVGEHLPHGPFDVPMPRGVTLHERVVSCRSEIDGPDVVRASLQGTPVLARTNGLGFDARRLEQGITDKGKILVDPVVEVLAWCALRLFPVVVERGRVRARGWTGPATRAGSFRWGVWAEPLDRWAIDALIDARRWQRPLFETVPYQRSGSSDVTRAYASRQVDDG